MILIRHFLPLVIFVLFVTNSVLGQSISAALLDENATPSDGEYFNTVLSKQNFAADLARSLVSELETRIKENPQYRSVVKSTFEQMQNLQADIANYNYKDAGKGRYYTFETKRAFEQFEDFIYNFNQIYELERLRTALLKTGNIEQNRRLLQIELTNAINIYNSGQFRTAREELNSIIDGYSSTFSQLDDVYFIRAEVNFGLKAFQNATSDYTTVLTKYNGTSSYTNQAVYKLLFIKYVYGDNEAIVATWEKYKNYVTIKDNSYFNTMILLGVVQNQRQDYPKSVSLLANYPKEFGGYILSRYISGNSYANMDSVDLAINEFRTIELTSLWPWDPVYLKSLQISAKIQLGYLFYIKGIKEIQSGRTKGNAYFEISKEYLTDISKNNPEYANTIMANAWIDLQNANYTAALQKIRTYISDISDKDVIYQAVFLEGYIKQKKNPGQLTESKDSYYYVINGMIANQFLTDFLANREIILRQSIKTKDYIDTKNIPAASLTAANSLSENLDEILAKISVSDNLTFNKDNRVLAEDKINGLNEDINTLNKKRELVRSKGLRELVLATDSTIIALKNIIDNPKAESINNEEVLFAEHTALLIQTTQKFVLNSYKDYRVLATSEKNRVSLDLRKVENALRTSKDIGKIPVLAYFKDQLSSTVDKFNALEVSLYEKDYYTKQAEIDRWGDASGYGLTSLLYQELERRQREGFEYSTTRGLIKKAIERKADQMEKYLSDLSRIDEQEKFISRIDSINSDFRLKLVDYRSVFFNPISQKEFPKKILDELLNVKKADQKTADDSKNKNQPNQKGADKKPTKTKDVNVKKTSKAKS